MEMLFYEFSHKLKRFCKHMKPNVTAVLRRLKRATKNTNNCTQKKLEKNKAQERGIFRK